jgi:EpsD family peptidyl-prolyl cis-trans isomerase
MRWIWMLSAAAMLSGCGDSGAPTGQVVATVSGDEITRGELNAALPGNVPKDPKAAAQVRNAVLEQLVAQRVITQEAKRENLDKSQEYLLAVRRAEGQILSDLMTRRVLQDVKVPDDAAIERFIAENPTRFADRVIFETDQLRAPANSVEVAALKDAHSLDAILAQLRVPQAQIERRRVSVDSVGLPPAATKQLLTLPSGEPFVIKEGGLLTASTIQSTQKMPLGGDQARKVAIELMKQEAGNAAITRRYDVLRKGVSVQYQSGFGPAPTASPAVKPR